MAWHPVPLDFSTSLTALGGGALIGLSATLLYLSHGRVAGISGILAGFVNGPSDERSPFGSWFLLGLLLAGFGLRLGWPASLPASASLPSLPWLLHGSSLALMVPAGLLVGYGTRLGGGCTSGHGVCGLARLSTRSLLATMTFMATAAITVFLTRHLGGVAP